jgi:pimeloyl-ACP methyl ester carboxylesterase
MSELTTGMLDVPGARLYFEVRGAGPGLLIIPTGNGDASPFGFIADLLADRYTVITYDRRGLSRSPLNGPVDAGQRIANDVDDARRLIEHVGEAPACVFGGSSGAIVALALLERHPGLIGTLVAHEPPIASVVPDSARWLQFFDDLYNMYRSSGTDAAWAKFRATMGMSAPTRPPKEAELPPPQLAEMLARIDRNRVFWFEHEIRTYPAFVPDIAVLRSVSDRLVLACGDTSRNDFPHQVNLALAEQIGTGIVHFPGGHVGYVSHPAEFAETLLRAIAASDPGQSARSRSSSRV